jgi:hypothetical protein
MCDANHDTNNSDDGGGADIAIDIDVFLWRQSWRYCCVTLLL